MSESKPSPNDSDSKNQVNEISKAPWTLQFAAVFCYVGCVICAIKGVMAFQKLVEVLQEKVDFEQHLIVQITEATAIMYFIGFAGLLGIGQCCSRLGGGLSSKMGI